MSLKNTLSFIINHPLNREKKIKSIVNFIKWQIYIRLNPYPVICSFGEHSKLIVRKGMTGATGNLYCGLHEFEDMSFVLHFLTDSDLFVDIGANVGSYTILAGSEKNSQTISIEPIPDTFELLYQNVLINNIHENVKCFNIGLGANDGILKFTKSLDTTNHVASLSENDTVDVKIKKFDDFIKLDKITLVKMDVEGFETEVINGMCSALQNNNFKALIIELNGSGNRYNYDEKVIHEKLVAHGFLPYLYLPFKREFAKLEKHGTNNTIYIRDLEFVTERVRNAQPFKINGKSV